MKRILSREKQEKGAKIRPLGSKAVKSSQNFCQSSLLVALDRVLVGLNHLLYHLTTDATSLTGGKITVVAVLQVNANFACCLHLELFHSSLCFGNHRLIACHNFTPWFFDRSLAFDRLFHAFARRTDARVRRPNIYFLSILN